MTVLCASVFHKTLGKFYHFESQFETKSFEFIPGIFAFFFGPAETAYKLIESLSQNNIKRNMDEDNSWIYNLYWCHFSLDS